MYLPKALYRKRRKAAGPPRQELRPSVHSWGPVLGRQRRARIQNSVSKYRMRSISVMIHSIREVTNKKSYEHFRISQKSLWS